MRIECLDHSIMGKKTVTGSIRLSQQIIKVLATNEKTRLIDQQQANKLYAMTTIYITNNGDNIYKYTERKVKGFEASQIFFWYSTMNINVRMNTFNIQWTPDLVDFKGPEKFVSYCRSLLN
jgi:hypothetical protein